MKLKIEKNVPLLVEVSIGRSFMEAIENMKVGDSFEYPAKYSTACSQAIVKFRIKHPNSFFTTKSVGNGQRRAWRLK